MMRWTRWCVGITSTKVNYILDADIGVVLGCFFTLHLQVF